MKNQETIVSTAFALMNRRRYTHGISSRSTRYITPPSSHSSTRPSSEIWIGAVEGEEYTGEDAELAEILEAGLTHTERAIIEQADAGQAAHNDKVVSMTREGAVKEMAAQGVVISAAEQKAATKIFPKVSTLKFCEPCSLLLPLPCLSSLNRLVCVDQRPSSQASRFHRHQIQVARDC